MAMEALMERIRFKQAEVSQKSLAETSKLVRMSMADRRHSLDINDKAVLRSCLDTLQSSISVRSVTGMSERLETTARQLGLKFMPVHSASSITHNFYISTETFYVEIIIDKTGSILETRINHQNSQGSTQSTIQAPEISECLSRGDFDKFVDHLKGLISVYDLADCSHVDKSRAWQALFHLEHDLTLLASGQSWVTDINQMIHKTGLGMVHNRSGGLPMKLRYFLPPYELLDMKQKTLLPMNQSTITNQDLGFCATITLKSSKEPYLLPMSSLISPMGEDLQITNSNAIPLPAHFALVLDSPLPVSLSLLKQIISVTNIDCLNTDNSPLLALIVKQASDGALDPSNNRGLFVTLPDQQHCYFMTETPDLVGQLIEMIPFRHPNQVSAIIDILRRQALFNTLVSSCVRTNSLEDVDTSTMFEVTCLDPTCQTLSVSFEHPTEETMATAELSLSDLVAPRCLVYTGCMTVCPEETANKVLQRSLSIPITMRAVINKGKGKIKQCPPDEADISVGSHSSMNGVSHNMDSLDSKTVSSLGSGARYRMESSGLGGGGTPACVKQENMEVDAEHRSECLNMRGSQDTLESTGTRDTLLHLSTFRTPSTLNKRHDPSPGFRSSSDFYKSSKRESSSPKHSKEGRSVQPNVSITPVASQFEDSNESTGTSSGIEIIPLGGKLPSFSSSSSSSSGVLKAKSRDLKRSYSEDDKRKVQKKEKKRRDDKIRQSLNQESSSKAKYESDSSNSSWTLETDSKSNLAGVIERLSQKNKDNLSIEIKPASSSGGSVEKSSSSAPNMEITLNQVKREDYKPKLKLTIKPPVKPVSEKTETDGASSYYSKHSSASPKLESSTFQIPRVTESPTYKKERPSFPGKSSSTSPKLSKSPLNKINHERFITDTSKDRKRDSESQLFSGSVTGSSSSGHTSVSPALGELSPLSDSLLDEGLLMKWMILKKTMTIKKLFPARSANVVINVN